MALGCLKHRTGIAYLRLLLAAREGEGRDYGLILGDEHGQRRDWVGTTPTLYEFHANHKMWEGATFCVELPDVPPAALIREATPTLCHPPTANVDVKVGVTINHNSGPEMPGCVS